MTGAAGTPVPDPTVLTTEQLLRMETSIKEWSEALMKGMDAVVEEKFLSVEKQFDLVERQRVEQKKDTKDAVDAALAAAKEAVKEQTTASGLSINKSETATSEQLKQLNVTFTTAIAGVTASFNDLKERVSRIESGRTAVAESRTEQRLNVGAVVGIAGAAVGFLSLVAAVVFFAAQH